MFHILVDGLPFYMDHNFLLNWEIVTDRQKGSDDYA